MMSTDTRTIPFVDLKAQYQALKNELNTAITEVLESASFVGGRFVDDFEKAFARYCGVSHCVGVANGTDALFIALKALGVGPGDEVITAANTFIATAEAIRLAGAQVVFTDVNPQTYTIDAERLREKITAKTKAIIPVHLYGQPADMEPILAIAREHSLFIVADAAQAHGATYHGQPIAKLADITCFSFYPGKNLGAYGDAGALVTDNEHWAAAARMFANHGRIDKYDHAIEGINSRLDGVQAAILSVKLRHLDSWTDDRRLNAYRYNAALAGTSYGTPRELDNVRAVYHLYIVRVPDNRRNEVQAHLTANGVSCGIHYPIALPYLKAYRHFGHTERDFPQALKASQEILSLPMFPEMTNEDVQYVATLLKQKAR